MRVSDLIHIIQMSTSQTQETALRDDAWLALSRLAFPRRDLLSWYDGLANAPIAADQYFAGLVVAFTYAMARSGEVNRVVAAVGQTAPILQLQGNLGGAGQCTIWDLRNVITPPLLPEVPLHQVALTVGFFDDPGQAANMQTFIATNYYNAARLYFFSGAVYDEWTADLLPPADPSDVYRGRLHGAGDRDMRVIFRDRPSRLARPQR